MTGVFSFIVLVLSSCWILSWLRKRVKLESNGNHISNAAAGRAPAAGAPEILGVDLGALGTLRIAWEFKGTLWDDVAGYDRFMRIHARYGKLVRLFYNWLLTQQGMVLSDLKLAKQIFCSSAWLNRTLDSQNHYAYMTSFNKAIGILFGNGQHWKESRKIVVKLLREHNLLDQDYLEELYSTEIRPVLQDLHAKIDEQGGSAIFSPRHLFAMPVMNVIFKILFGRGLNVEERRKGGLLDQLDHCNSNFTAALSSLEYLPFMRYFPKFTFLGPVMKCCRAIYDIAEEEAMKRKSAGTYADQPKDLLDSYLKEVDAHEGKNPNYFTFEALQVNVRDLIFAGGETISAQMQHMIQQMAMNSDVQKKVQYEIDQVVGPERWPSYNDKNSMPYTHATILESLRFGSIVPTSARTCTQDYDLCNFKVKKGTHIAISYYSIHHSPEIWGDPETFRPERFLNEKNEIVNTDKMLPFSYGPRACPGELAGRLALFMFTVVLLREFSWEVSPAHPPPSLKLIKGLSRYPATYFVKMTRRTSTLNWYPQCPS